MIGTAIFAQLASLNASLSLGLTNPDGSLRIYPGYQHMADKAYPAICYDYENYTPDVAFDGAAGTAVFDLKIMCIGDTYNDADTLGQHIAQALDATKGTWGTVTVQGCFLEEITTDRFLDTDMESILYWITELTFHVAVTI